MKVAATRHLAATSRGLNNSCLSWKVVLVPMNLYHSWQKLYYYFSTIVTFFLLFCFCDISLGGSISNEKNIKITDCHQNHFTVFQYNLHQVYHKICCIINTIFTKITSLKVRGAYYTRELPGNHAVEFPVVTDKDQSAAGQLTTPADGICHSQISFNFLSGPLDLLGNSQKSCLLSAPLLSYRGDCWAALSAWWH